MKSLFKKKPNRKAQVIVAGAATAITAFATGGLSLLVAGVAGATWWITGKSTEK